MDNKPTNILNHEEWDYYDINLGLDMGVVLGSASNGVSITNDIIPYPRDLEEPDEFIEVKRIEAFYVGKMTNPTNSQQRYQRLDILIGLFEFNQTDNGGGDYGTTDLDELKEAIARLSLEAYQPANSTNFAGQWELKFHDYIDFEKPFLFPLNPSVKLIHRVTDSSFSLFGAEEDGIFLRIWYRKKKQRLGLFGRILALFRQEISG